uniref:Uncharacterized protein n=1 Tax=Arundo donax TaxID=35708 RepID=A0A0A9GV66_ARUDO
MAQLVSCHRPDMASSRHCHLSSSDQSRTDITI